MTLCPDHSTVVSTVVVPVSTTICPVTEWETPEPTSYPTPPPATYSVGSPEPAGTPTDYPVAPPASTVLPPPPPPPPASVPEESAAAEVPAATESSYGTITAPSPTNSDLTPVTAGAAQNVQRAGGALAVVALVAALI